jgi:hypothetical protein
MIRQDEKIEIIENMEKFGGSFVKALSQCILRADPSNLQKLEDAFGEYFEMYKKENW